MAGTISEDRYITPTIETVRIVNVNVSAWSVDLVSMHGGKLFFDIQISSPYFHYFNGEGIYVMPEVGALAWLCKPSEGRFSEPFLMGFQAPFDENDVSYRCNRQNLNPGDIMIRTRDENFVILRRGGVVQIGATPTAQRIYVPIQNFIRDFCENYQMFTFGGELTWLVDRDDQTTDGSSPAKFSLKAKDKANDPQFVAELTIGSHGEEEATKLEMRIFSDGSDQREEKILLKMTKEGEVSWAIEGDWSVSAKGSYIVESREGDVTVESKQKTVSISAEKDLSLRTNANMLETVKGNSKETVQGTKIIDSPLTKIGNTAVEPGVLGNQLVTLLSQILTMLNTIAATPVVPSPGAPAAVPLSPVVVTQAASAAATLSTILAKKVILE